MNQNTRSRLLLFFIGIPLFVLVVLFLPHAHYAVLALLVIGIQYLSSIELRSLITKSGFRAPGSSATFAGIAQNILVYAACLLNLHDPDPIALFFLTSILFLLIELTPQAFARKDEFPYLLKDSAAIVLLHAYTAVLPGFLMLIIAYFPDARSAILAFTIMTFGNDSLAWLAGITLGKKRNIVDVSPNKSIAGFIGGTAGSIIGAFLALGPLAGSWKPSGGAYIALSLMLGCGMSFFVIVGDLFESALKRAVGVKDSGILIPGRGGMLDSFDSLFFSAPFFVAFALLARLFS
ncbi:MAG: phosphatidate cytidylyltransferase [Rectinema sp.]|nr:phosphatidate cytidylyltransferase [Rectinema sp.]